MPELSFQKKGHKYFLDGKEIPSVSELTRFLSREVYGEIDPIALERAAEKGTKIHEATEVLDRNGEVEVDTELGGYIEAYMKFRKDHKINWLMLEGMMEFNELYAGTLDRLGKVDGKLCILDIKTNKTIGKQHKALYQAQLNLYRLACEQQGVHPDTLYILHLKQNGKYSLINIPFNTELALACITLHYSLKK